MMKLLKGDDQKITGTQIRAIRVVNRIPGTLLCQRFGRSRGWLSNVELGHCQPSVDEMRRLSDTLDFLITVRTEVERSAVALGWPAASALFANTVTPLEAESGVCR